MVRELPDWVNSNSQVDEDIYGACLLALCLCVWRGEGGRIGSEKNTMASASTYFWDKDAPPALVLKPDMSYSCRFLEPFKLLPQCWNSAMTPSNDSV